jgi:hypothetical protein
MINGPAEPLLGMAHCRAVEIDILIAVELVGLLDL